MPEYKIWRTSDPEGQEKPAPYAYPSDEEAPDDEFHWLYEIESLGDLFWLLSNVKLPVKIHPKGGIEICDQERSEEQ